MGMAEGEAEGDRGETVKRAPESIDVDIVAETSGKLDRFAENAGPGRAVLYVPGPRARFIAVADPNAGNVVPIEVGKPKRARWVPRTRLAR